MDLRIVLVDPLQKTMKDSRYICQKELDKACFQYDMGYGNFEDLSTRTASDKIFRDKVFKTSDGAATLANKSGVKNENISQRTARTNC